MNTTTKNQLTLEESKLLNGLKQYLDVELYYYGSIQRNDYIPGKSDIDVAIFTNNEQDILIKMQHYLNVPRYKFKKVLWKLQKNNYVTYGYKLKYNTKTMHIEFAIYNEKSKDDIIKFQSDVITIPSHITWLLNILKIIYYQFHLITLSTYNYLKRKIFSFVNNNGKEEQFIILNEYPIYKSKSNKVKYNKFFIQ
jgi:predicted nucleotidyltransferase